MKQHILNDECTGKSPCYKCHYEKYDKDECSELCIALKRFRFGKAYSHIDRYQKVEPAKPEAVSGVVTDVIPEIKVVETELNGKALQLKDNVCKDKKCLICGREESDKVKIRRGLCVSPHYQNWRAGKIKHPVFGDFVKMGRKELSEARYGKFKKCLIDGCPEIGDRRGLCQKGGHYKQCQKGRILHPELGEFFTTRKRRTKMKVVEKSLKHEMEEREMVEGKKEFDFNDIVENRINKIRSVLAKKAQEYASDKSRFHNFEVAGRRIDCTPERALLGMMVKHEVSVMDLVNWIEFNPEKLTFEIIDEKICDNINYLILLEGMLKKRVL